MSGECEEWDEDSEKSNDDQDSLCMILVEETRRHRDRELQKDPSSGTYNLDQQEVCGGEQLERIAVSRKPFRELSCNSNVRTNLVQAKPYAVGQYVWVFQNVIPPMGTKKQLKKWRGPFMITEVHQQGRFYRLSTGRAAHYENLKPHAPSPEDWCVPQNMEGLEYLLVEPACEVNEKGTREKNDGNEDVSMDDNEKIEAGSDAESFAEEDWNDPEQDEVPKWTEPDLPITAGTRSGNRKRTGMRYNRYGDDVMIDKIQRRRCRTGRGRGV